MKKTLIQSLTQNQFQNTIIASAIIMMVLSLFEPTSWAMFIGLVMLAPLGLGYVGAAFVDRMDDSADYKIELTKKAHFGIGFAFAVAVGMVWSVVGTRVPVFPLNPFTNALFTLVAPKALFLLWAFVLCGIGYWRAWKTIVPHAGRH